jgi:hypothetical protein
MRIFSFKTAYLLSLFCLALLYLPKINFISFSTSETAGVRIDDIVLFGTSIFFFWAFVSLRRKFLDVEKLMFTIILFSLFSFLCNKILVTLGMIFETAVFFYAVRLFEYFIFFYIGLAAANVFRLQSVLTLFFGLNVVFIVLQKAGLVGAFTSLDGYVKSADDRPQGIASFPSEMGVLLNILFCYFIYSDCKTPKFVYLFPPMVRHFCTRYSEFILFFIFGILIVITGSRIAIAALFVSFLPVLSALFRKPTIAKFVASFTMITLASLAFAYGIYAFGLAERSKGLFSLSNIELARSVWDNIHLKASVNSDQLFISQETQDESWFIRIHKWAYAFKAYVMHPECYLQGIGPGFSGAALDGGLVRIFVEYGLIGFFLFMKFFKRLAGTSRALFWIVVSIFINMVFFDVYLAYKPMSMLFLIAGYEYANQLALVKNRKEVLNEKYC